MDWNINEGQKHADLEFEVDGEVHVLPSWYVYEDSESIEHEKDVLSAAVRRGEDISDIYNDGVASPRSVRAEIRREMKYRGCSASDTESFVQSAMKAFSRSL